MIARRSEKGYVVYLALVLAVVFAGYIVALLQTSVSETKAAKTDMSLLRATQIAEAGIEHARVFLGTQPDGFHAALLGCNGTPDGEGDDSDDGVLDFDGDGQGDSIVAYANGTYSVRVTDNTDGDGDPYTDSDNELLVTSFGRYGKVGTTIKIHAYRLPGTFVPLHAILTNGYLDLGGTADILGTAANVHSNSDINLHGNPTIAGNVTSTGNITVVGGADAGVGGAVLGSQPEIPVPDLHASDFRPLADYVFKTDGNIYDGDGNFLYNCTGGLEVDGWSYNAVNSVWQQTGVNRGYSGDSLTGFLYFESDVQVTGNARWRTTPWECSIISEGDLAANGNSLHQMVPDEDVPIVYFAEKDLQINGTADATFEGIFYAREQFKVNGTASIIGSILGFNATSTDTGDDLVELDVNEFNLAVSMVLGTFSLQCDGDMTLKIPGDPNMRIRCWVRE